MTNTTKGPELGPIGFGKGSFIAVSALAGASAVAGIWGFTQIATAEDGGLQALRTGSSISSDPAPQSDGTVTVELEDEDGNGVADLLEQEPADEDPAGPPDGEDRDASATQEEDEATPEARESESESEETSASRADVYVIEPGDTLAEISGETGVPIGYLVEANRIEDPDLIFAGASLLIPPV